jgi:hypothetical protein
MQQEVRTPAVEGLPMQSMLVDFHKKHWEELELNTNSVNDPEI